MSRIFPGDELYHLTQAGINEACAPYLATILASQCCVMGNTLLAMERLQAGGAHAADVDTLREFAVTCQHVIDGKREGVQ